jgi:serine/threonine protein kinase
MGEPSLERYQIRRVLGRGGTGTVYEAYDSKTDALVAL